MADKTTTVRLTDDDQACISKLSKKTGVQSVTDVLRLSLRRALDLGLPPRAENDTSDAESPRVAELEAALLRHHEALGLWAPQDFDGARAKAKAEEAFAKTMGGRG